MLDIRISNSSPWSTPSSNAARILRSITTLSMRSTPTASSSALLPTLLNGWPKRTVSIASSGNYKPILLTYHRDYQRLGERRSASITVHACIRAIAISFVKSFYLYHGRSFMRLFSCLNLCFTSPRHLQQLIRSILVKISCLLWRRFDNTITIG